MSLINNMLNDLDHRQADGLHDIDPVIADLEAIDSFSIRQKNSHGILYTLLALLFLLLAVMGSAYLYRDSVSDWMSRIFEMTSSSGHHATDSGLTSTLKDETSFQSGQYDAAGSENYHLNQQGEILDESLLLAFDNQITMSSTTAIDQYLEDDLNEPAQTTQRIHAIDYKVIDGRPNIVFRFAEEPRYRINILESPSRLLIDISDMDDSTNWQQLLNNAPEFIRNQRTKYVDGIFSYVYEFDQPVNLVDAYYANSEQQHELQIVLDVDISTAPEELSSSSSIDTDKQDDVDVLPAFAEIKLQEVDGAVPADVVSRETINKVVHRQDGVLSADKLYESALLHYRQGNLEQSESELEQAITVNPLHAAARMLLSEIYLATARNTDAINLLINGLENDISHSAMAKLCAQLLQQQGNTALALMYLQAAMPAVSEDPEYIALTAALLQQEQRYAESIQYYQQLLRLDQQQGLWWMGLAISLEALGSETQALEAFRNARRDAGLTAEVRTYIQQRISSLQS